MYLRYDQRALDQNLMERQEIIYLKSRYFGGAKLQIMQNLSISGLESNFFFDVTLRVSKKNISSFIAFTLTIINPKMILRQLLS